VKALQSLSVSFHCRDAALPAVGDAAIPSRFHGRADAFPARVFDSPTIGGGGFLPADVATVALPSIDDDAIPDRFRGDFELEPAGVAGLPDVASGSDPDPAARVVPANAFLAVGGLGNPWNHAIPDGFSWVLPSMRPQRYKRHHRIAVDLSERNTLFFSAHWFSHSIPPRYSFAHFGFIMTDGQFLILIIDGKQYEMMSNL
jgi:hypothetical protein